MPTGTDPRGGPPGYSRREIALVAAYIAWTFALVKLLLARAAEDDSPYYLGMLMTKPMVVLAATAGLGLLLWVAWRVPGGESPGRRAVFWAGLAIVVFIACAIVSPAYAGRIVTVLLGGVIFAVLVGAGRRIVRLVLGEVNSLGRSEVAAYSAAAGLGAGALVVLGLGAAGLASRWVLLALLSACAVACRRDIRDSLLDVTSFLSECSGRFSFALWLALALGGVFATGVLLSVFIPPYDYDVLEYHLAMPREFLWRGSTGVLEHNAFSGMPLGSEMLSMMALALRPGGLWGVYLAKVLVALSGLAAAVPVYGLAARLAGRRAGAVAAAAFLWAAGSALLFSRAYAEPLLTLQALAAFLCMMSAMTADGRTRTRRLVLCGLLAGLAAGTKYTPYVLVLVPAVCAVAISSILRRRGAKGTAADVAAVVVAFLAAVLPWIVRSLYCTGEPFYPLLASEFGLAGWSPERAARFAHGHAPQFGVLTALERLFGPPVGYGRGFRDAHEYHMSSPLMAVFAPFAILYSIRERKGGVLWAMAAAWIVLWLAFTHRIPRFAFPALGLLAALAGLGYAELARGRLNRMVAGGLAGWAFVAAAGVVGACPGVKWLDIAAGEVPEAKVLRSAFRGEAAAFEQINALPESSRVLLVAEAKTLYLPPGRVGYRTVFDDSELAGTLRAFPSPAGAAEELVRRGYTHVYFNWMEFRRLETTYAFESGGRSHGGYADLNAAEWARLREIIVGEFEKVWTAGPPSGPGFGEGGLGEGRKNLRWAQSWGRLAFRRWSVGEGTFVLYRIRRATGVGKGD